MIVQGCGDVVPITRIVWLVYYTSSSSKPTTINFYDSASRSAKRLFSLPQQRTPGGGLSVSPDGRWLLYTQTDDAQNDIMLGEGFR